MPAGRPRVITKEKEKVIVRCFVDGLTDEETALFTDISRKTISRMRAGEYCPDIKKATLARRMFYLKKLRDGRRQDWTRIAWYLERLFPQQFCKPEVALAITQNTLNQTTNNSLILTAEVAEGVLSRIKEANSKVTELFKNKRGSNKNDKTENGDQQTTDG
jgi:hypothetical protein